MYQKEIDMEVKKRNSETSMQDFSDSSEDEQIHFVYAPNSAKSMKAVKYANTTPQSNPRNLSEKELARKSKRSEERDRKIRQHLKASQGNNNDSICDISTILLCLLIALFSVIVFYCYRAAKNVSNPIEYIHIICRIQWSLFQSVWRTFIFALHWLLGYEISLYLIV